jgi:nitric oxide reductase activation protein
MFVDFDRPAEAAGLIRALLLDPEERARRGAAARVAAARLLGRDYVASFRAEVLDPPRDRP